MWTLKYHDCFRFFKCHTVKLVPATLLTQSTPDRIGNAHPMLVPYRLYRAKDRSFNLGVGTDSLWQRFCSAIDMPDLSIDPRFTTNSDRVRNRVELEKILDELFRLQTADYWLHHLRDARIPCGPVNTLLDILGDDHLLARKGLVEIDHPLIGKVPMLANPIHFSANGHHWQMKPNFLIAGFFPSNISTIPSAALLIPSIAIEIIP